MADFRIKVDYFAWLEKRIGANNYIARKQLADALRGKDTLPFPEVFLDYLCRFLAGEVKRPRGRPKVSHSKGQHFGEISGHYLEHITKRVELCDYVSGSELADVLRRGAAGQIPDVLLEYLCRFLTGDIKKPRGRSPMRPGDKRRRDMIVNGAYRRYTEYLLKREAREGKAAGWTHLPYPPAEIAARIIARNYYYGCYREYLCYYGEHSWRSVQTVSSSYRKWRN